MKPNAILTVNATQFHSDLWKKQLKENEIKSFYTSVSYPQEKIGRLLQAWCFAKHFRWACVLDDVEECVNNIVDESTGFASAFLVFGRTEPNAIERIVDFRKEDRPCPPLTHYWKLAHEQLLPKSQKRKLKIEARYKPTIFRPGDLVLVKQHRPYSIKRSVGPNSYMVDSGFP